MLSFGFVLALSVASCDAGNADVTADALARDPERLQIKLRECRSQIVPAEDPACRAASEAWRRRFFGDQPPNKTEHAPSTPQPPALPPAEPLTTAPTPWLAGS